MRSKNPHQELLELGVLSCRLVYGLLGSLSRKKHAEIAKHMKEEIDEWKAHPQIRLLSKPRGKDPAFMDVDYLRSLYYAKGKRRGK